MLPLLKYANISELIVIPIFLVKSKKSLLLVKIDSSFSFSVPVCLCEEQMQNKHLEKMKLVISKCTLADVYG